MTTPIIHPEVKPDFPDALLDRLIAKTDEIMSKVPQSEIDKMTEEQLTATIKLTGSCLVIGAKEALDYIKEKAATTNAIINPSTLTEEQRKAIIRLYNGGLLNGELDFIELISSRNLLKRLFGKSIFEHKGE